MSFSGCLYHLSSCPSTTPRQTSLIFLSCFTKTKEDTARSRANCPFLRLSGRRENGARGGLHSLPFSAVLKRKEWPRDLTMPHGRRESQRGERKREWERERERACETKKRRRRKVESERASIVIGSMGSVTRRNQCIARERWSVLLSSSGSLR